MTTQAYILLSGGMDSATLLAKAIDTYGQQNVTALNINYGQQHKAKEMNCAALLCDYLGVPYKSTDISQVIGQGGLSDPEFQVPNTSYAEIKGVSPTYVPFRNGLLLSVIASKMAAAFGPESQDVGVIGYGAHAEDAENWAYPDCTPEFIGAMANAIYIGTYTKIRLYTPLMWLSKSQVVDLGELLGVPWHLTWSCYKGEELHCGTCPTCRARKGAFAASLRNDPTEYAA